MASKDDKPSNWRRFFRSVLDGMAAPNFIYDTEIPEFQPFKPQHKSAEDALRSDWEKIGGDMWKVIYREQEAIEKKRKEQTPGKED